MHVAPSTTTNGKLEVYGAPPLSVVSSAQLRLQPTSFGYDPPEQVIAEEMVEGGDGEGSGGGGLGDGGGGDGDGGGTGQAVWQTYLFSLVQEKSFHLPEL